MAAALDTRYLSGLKEERVAASAVLNGPDADALRECDCDAAAPCLCCAPYDVRLSRPLPCRHIATPR